MTEKREYIRPELVVNLAEAAAKDINRYLSQPFGDLLMIAANPLFDDYFKNLGYDLFEEAEVCRGKLEQYLLKFSGLNENYFRLRFTDAKGGQLIRIENRRISTEKENLGEKPYFKECLKCQNGQVRVSGLERDEKGGLSLMVYSTPYYHANLGLKGLIFLELNFGAVQDMLKGLTSGKGDYSYIIDNEGKVIAHSDRPELSGGIKEHENVIRLALSRKTGWLKYRRDSALFLAAYAPIIRLAWALAVIVPAPEKAKIETFTRALKTKIGELEESNKLKSDFIATVSHELRTPLAIMQEAILSLLDGLVGEISQEQRSYLETVVRNEGRLARLINNLLDISKLEAGKTRLNKRTLDLGALIKRNLATMGPKIAAKNIALEIKFPKDLPKVSADSDKIDEVFLNLLENAVKFNREGGKIIVAAKKSRNDHLEISVADTGIGIAAEDIPKLFSKFYQIGRQPGPGAKGTGLGLAICREIITLHGGKIRAESKQGKGSVFTFTLPAGKRRARPR